MTRRKVNLSFIENHSDRKASYKKRRKGLMKKAQELSTLCGIDACVILYGPYGDEPEVWPQDPNALNRILAKFKDVPIAERTKRTVNQEGFTQQRIEKLREQLKRVIKENRDMEVTYLINQCLAGTLNVENFALPDLNDIGSLLQRNLKDINRRMAYLKKHEPQVPQPQPPEMEMMQLDDETKGGNLSSTTPRGGMFQGSLSSMLIAPPRMPMNIDGPYHHNHQMQNFAWNMGMMRINEPPRFEDFGWAYNAFLSPPATNSNNGVAAPGYNGIFSNSSNSNGAGDGDGAGAAGGGGGAGGA